jgi:hypothetical protein
MGRQQPFNLAFEMSEVAGNTSATCLQRLAFVRAGQDKV